MKMVNNCIATVDLDEVIAKQGNFIVASKNNKFKRLEVKELPDTLADMTELEVGSVVFVLATAGVEIPVGDITYTVIKQQDILMIE